MKNLKRALSLVLSTAMLAGMMMVGTGAAFDDVTAEHNEEAIAVVSAAGIMGANEEFNPDAKITRNEMAVVMCNMLGLDTDDFVGASNFTDVPAWAEGYVDACFANGIVSGVSATQYNGSANVTTGEAALMMMKALGYFQYAGDFEGDWLMATIKQASKIDLLDNIDAGAKTAMTRNEVAQLALNALESKVVYATKAGTTTSITTSDVQIEVTGEATYHDEIDNDNYDYNRASSKDPASKLFLIEKLYGEDFLKKAYTTDLNQPGSKWEDMTQKMADRKIIAVADEPEYTVVVDKKDLKNILDVYNEYIDDDAKDADAFAYGTVTAEDGTVSNVKTTYYALNGANYKDAAPVVGDVIEFYTNSDNKVTDVVTIRYSIGEITKIDTKTLTKADKDADATCKATINKSITALDSNFVGFDYEEDDIILYVPKMIDGKQHIIASKLADTVEGKVSSVKGSKATIAGDKYIIIPGVAVNVADEGTFYLGEAGQIMKTDTTSASEDYLYIYSIEVDETGRNADGVKTTVVTAYTVDTEGTKASYEMAIDNVTEAETEGLKRGVGKYLADTTIVVNKDLEKASMVRAYSINSDDQLVLETAKDFFGVYDGAKDEETGTVNNLVINKNKASGTSAATEFIFVEQTASSVKISTATGYKNVNVNQTATTVYNEDGDVLYVFVDGKNGSVTTDANLAVVLDSEYAAGKNADGDKTFTYTVAIDGVESELTFKADQKFTDGKVIAYEFDGDWAVIDEENQAKIGTKVIGEGEATDDYIVLDKQYNLTGDEVMYTIVKVYEDANEDGILQNTEKLDSVSVTEGADVEKGDTVYYTVDDDVIDTLFVVEKTW